LNWPSRGLIERVLIVCPANLAFQWQRELRDKFDEQFEVLKGGDIREQLRLERRRLSRRSIWPSATKFHRDYGK
jgi:SNF2 family DNA or RNA helicase